MSSSHPRNPRDRDSDTALLSPPAERPALPPAEKKGEHGHEEVIPKDLPRPGILTVLFAATGAIVLLIALFVIGYIPTRNAAAQAKTDAAEHANNTPLVAADHPKLAEPGKDIILPCDIRANQQTAIYPRATGYLKELHADIQKQVKAGDVLAVIDAPDIDAQLREDEANYNVALATVENDKAALHLADVTLKRFVESQKSDPGSVAQQDIDTKQAAYDQAAAALKQAEASVESAKQEVERLKVLKGFEIIYAPFDGVITARNYDIGALLNPANVGPGQQLFSIAQTDLLRVYVSVPQAYATQLKIGQPAFVKVRNYPTSEFQGEVARSAGALDQATRTMTFELDFHNKDGLLFPGMYGTTRLGVFQPNPSLVIPTSALIFNADGSQVAVVRDNKIHFQKISVGRDLGTSLEIASGLTQDDTVVSNPSSQLTEGSVVKVQLPQQQTALAPVAPEHGH